MAKPMYVWNGSAWEAVAPTVPESPISYQASAPVSPSTGDIWVDSDGDVGTFDRQLVRYRFVASGGETSLSGVDANGFTLAYVPGAEQVYLNGVLLVRTSDYTATNGTSITALSPALAANDVVEVFAYNSFNLANTYTKAEVDGSLDLKTDVSANGLVHINTTTMSAVASQSVDNVFSADYKNYKIIISCISSTGSILFHRWRVGGVDNSAANYDYQSLVANGTGVTAARTQNNTSNTWGNMSNVNPTLFIIDVTNPFLVDTTTAISHNAYTLAALLDIHHSHFHDVAASFDGFSLIANTGTMTGQINVYGYKE